MNTLGTIYKPPLKMTSTMSPGIISKFDGQGFGASTVLHLTVITGGYTHKLYTIG